MPSEVKKRSSKSSKAENVSTPVDKTVSSKKDDKDKSKKNMEVEGSSPDPPPKFGPMPPLSPHRLWSRSALILGLMTVVWWNSTQKNETPFAIVGEDIGYRTMHTKCSSAFEKHVAKFPSCVPKQCGRLITDEIISGEEMMALSDLALRGFSPLKGDVVENSPTVLDLGTGTLKYSGGKSLNVFRLNKTSPIFQSSDLLIFQSIKSKLSRMVSSFYKVDIWSLHLAAPVFFSRISGPTPRTAKNKADEYWHPTVHQELFGSFDYSTMVFLSDFGGDFDGGRFVFLDGDNTNRTIEGRKGRTVVFTSGEESRHFTQKVERGNRIAFIMGFTCDSSKSVKDPSF